MVVVDFRRTLVGCLSPMRHEGYWVFPTAAYLAISSSVAMFAFAGLSFKLPMVLTEHKDGAKEDKAFFTTSNGPQSDKVRSGSL